MLLPHVFPHIQYVDEGGIDLFVAIFVVVFIHFDGSE